MLATPASTSAARRPALLLLLALFAVSVLFSFVNQSTYDSGDSLNHYLYARYAFQHPLNFLESWSKPLVVLLHALPAQAGLRGVVVFQCVCVAVAAWLAYGTARRLRLPGPWLAIVFVYASPDYFRIQYSGLTEPLFSVVLMAGVALAVAQRPVWAAAVLSFLPFVRSEGFLLLGVMGVYLLAVRAWRAVPWLALGYVVYGVAGLVAYHDFWWVFTRNAYPYQVAHYGRGELLHFVRSLPSIVGWVVFGLAVLGGVQVLWAWAQPARRRQPTLFWAELLLVYGSAAVYIGAHSVFWWRGIFASFGLTRVLDAMVPLLALAALNGLSFLTAWAPTETARQRLRLAVAGAAVLVLFVGLRTGFRWQRDFTLSSDQQLAAQLAKQLRRPLPLVVYAHPVLPYALEFDPFDQQQARGMPAVRAGEPLPVGTLVVWDDWFARTEAGVPLAQLQQDPQYRQLWQGAIPRDQANPSTDSVRFVLFERNR